MNSLKNKIDINLFFAFITMILWGSLFPCIKIGYRAFNIDATNVSQILMFAGVRFVVCGIIIIAIALFRKERLTYKFSQGLAPIIWTGVFAITLHYSCTYIGLSLTDSSKTAILKQLGALFYICFAFLFVKGETFSFTKIVGAILGFAGILAINAGVGTFSISVGDIFIIGASVFTVASSMTSIKAMQKTPPIMMTGISQLIGGTILVIISLIMGDGELTFTVKSIPVFGYICFATIVAYCLWNYVISRSELSKNLIIKFSEPLFACIFGAILLGEDIFKWQYAASFVLISMGIVIANSKGLKK